MLWKIYRKIVKVVCLKGLAVSDYFWFKFLLPPLPIKRRIDAAFIFPHKYAVRFEGYKKAMMLENPAV